MSVPGPRIGIDNVVPMTMDRTTVDITGALSDTDLANARRLATRHGRDLRYTREGRWLVYTCGRWVMDEKAVNVQALAKDTALSIYDEIKSAPNREATMRHAKRSQSKTAIEAMIALARSESGILTSLSSFDQDPLLLNVRNGTLDLRNATLRPHRRDDLITRMVMVDYQSDAACALWEAFLWRITDDSEELYAYLRRLVGYLLTGLTTEQVLHFLFGLGANGKSVFCEVLAELLGDYAIVASPEMVMARRYGGIPNDIARLRGVRVAMMNETSQGASFDEAKLKDLTGSDSLSARFLHAEYFDFRPTHKLIIRGNHKPAIAGNDAGIWRRMRLVPFTVEIPAAEQDHRLLEKLRAELPGILRWAVEGCLEWQAQGLRPPAIITEAVNQYRTESDTLGRFIDEQCETRALGQVKSSVFYQRYQTFAERAGERSMPSKDLPHEMLRRGVEWKRVTTGSFYYGIDFRGSDEMHRSDQ